MSFFASTPNLPSFPSSDTLYRSPSAEPLLAVASPPSPRRPRPSRPGPASFVRSSYTKVARIVRKITPAAHTRRLPAPKSKTKSLSLSRSLSASPRRHTRNHKRLAIVSPHPAARDPIERGDENAAWLDLSPSGSAFFVPPPTPADGCDHAPSEDILSAVENSPTRSVQIRKQRAKIVQILGPEAQGAAEASMSKS